MLKQHRVKQRVTRAIIETLLLSRQYSYPALKEALQKTLHLSCFHVETLRLLLSAERSSKREPSETIDIHALLSYYLPQPTTKNYNQLL